MHTIVFVLLPGCYAQVTHDVSHLTCADFLRAPGVQTPVIVRFSTVVRGGVVVVCVPVRAWCLSL